MMLSFKPERAPLRTNSFKRDQPALVPDGELDVMAVEVGVKWADGYWGDGISLSHHILPHVTAQKRAMSKERRQRCGEIHTSLTHLRASDGLLDDVFART